MPVFTADDLGGRQQASRGVKVGKLLRLATNLFSDEIRRAPEAIVRDNWDIILGKTMPGAVITDRSAFLGTPKNGLLFVDHPRGRDLELPGLTIVPSGSPEAGPQPGDTPLPAGIYLASEQRALLDNQKPSRAVKGRPSRTLTRNELHDEIVRLTTSRTPVQRQRLMESVQSLASSTGRTDGADSVRVFFESASGVRPTVKSGSRAMRAAQSARQHDQGRVRLFESLANQLRSRAPSLRPEPRPEEREFLPLFEAYFSNYIEGTEFPIDDAIDIALGGNIPAARPADAHDIKGTYEVVNDLDGMRTPIGSADDFLDVMRERHAAIMAGRPEKNPGVFKQRSNRAGLTEFVHPDMVEGTLRAGWKEWEGIDDPFSRAVFVMFLVAEVHPFDDGNGRIARIMMNGELLRLGETRIIVPTLLRDEYLSGMSSMTHNDRARGLITVMDFAQQHTQQTNYVSLLAARRDLVETNAYLTAREAEDQMVRLLLPNTVRRAWPEAVPTLAQQPRSNNAGELGTGGKWAGKQNIENNISLGAEAPGPGL